MLMSLSFRAVEEARVSPDVQNGHESTACLMKIKRGTGDTERSWGPRASITNNSMSLIRQVNNYADGTIFARITDQESYGLQQ